MSIPQRLRYTWDHEWPAVEGGSAAVGITAFAAEALGDVVHLRLPEVGAWGEAGKTESPTAASDLYAPASGEVLEVNTVPAGDAGVVDAAYSTGWLSGPQVENIAGALSADAYAAHRAHPQGNGR